MTTRMPAVFLGHGNPMLALLDTDVTRRWQMLGQALPRPKAILAISAHWYLPQTAVTAMAQPRTIHDFGGFPRALYSVAYPCPGDPQFAAEVARRLAPEGVESDLAWGLDHGTWAVLRHLYPAADIPVIQLSLDARLAPHRHYARAKRLASLREEGVLILGSGNIVHNLALARWEKDPAPYDWAERFDTWVRQRIEAGEHAPLLEMEAFGEDGQRAVPTPEHYLPLLYVLGVKEDNDSVGFPVSGIDMGSISMTAVQMGG